MPDTLTSTMSPGARGPTPPGVPVAITSPGSRVITWAIQRMTVSMEKIMSRMGADCLLTPFT